MASKSYMKGILTVILVSKIVDAISHDYGDALSKSILFFEGQRSGALPSNQRLNWRRDSALKDGSDNGVDLTGGYYDAGDNVKYSFPMAFSITMLAWSVIEYGDSMGTDHSHALEAIRWGTDFLLKCTNTPGTVYALVGNPVEDHNCWQRPEDMQTPRTSYAVTQTSPGSEVSAEIAAALAASSIVFQASGDGAYANVLLQRAIQVFEFGDMYRGNYKESIGHAVCPFYCDFNGYEDELVWAAAWLHKATGNDVYFNYVSKNIDSLQAGMLQFDWDGKYAGISVLVSKYVLNNPSLENSPFLSNAESFMCDIMPESPTRTVQISPGGLLTKPGMCNMQNVNALSFLLLTHAQYLQSSGKTIHCNNVNINPQSLVQFAKTQVDYILGDNPLGMSYMVGYGNKFPKRIHHRGASIPSISVHPQLVDCHGGSSYCLTDAENPNLLMGAVVGGPNGDDAFADSRLDPGTSEPTTYVNAPLVGLLAYFKQHSQA